MAPKDWSTRVGTIKAGSITEVEKGIKAVVVNKDNKEMTVGAYNDAAIKKVRDAAEKGTPHIFRGDLLGRGETLHVGVQHVAEQGAPKAEKSADKPKADKAEKAPKPELTDEEKAARAEANRARALERDATRVAVVSGSVTEGDKLDLGDKEVSVTKLGAEFEVTEANKPDLLERFGTEFNVGDKVQYASYDAPELDNGNEPS